MIYDAWNKLTSTTIFNCYKHAGFVRDSSEDLSVSADNDNFDDEDDLQLSVWAKGLPIANAELEQYSAVDDDLATCEERTHQSAPDEAVLENIIANNEDSEDNDDDEVEEISTTPSVSAALKAAEVLNVFVHSNFSDDDMKSIMSRLHNAIRTSYFHNKCEKQSKITDFLH